MKLLRTFSKTWGSHGDTPVLMVHGVQDNAGSFDNLIPLLPQNGFFYICIDLPGHGRSSHYPPHMCYTIMGYVENIRIIILEHLKLETFCYIGHSMGGHIGFILAAAFPDRVIKFIALDSILVRIVPTRLLCRRVRERLNEVVNLEQRLVDKTPPKYTYDGAIERIVRGRMTPLSESGAKVLAKRSLYDTDNGFMFTTDQRLKLHVGSEFSLEQYKNLIDNIKCPAMIILADNSVRAFHSVMKANHQRLYKNSKRFRQVIVDGTHDVHLINPERVAPIITKLLLMESKSKL